MDWAMFWTGWTCGTAVGLLVGLGFAWWFTTRMPEKKGEPC